MQDVGEWDIQVGPDDLLVVEVDAAEESEAEFTTNLGTAGEVGHVAVLDPVGNVSTFGSYGLAVAVVSTDEDAGWGQCAGGLCVQANTDITGFQGSTAVVDDGELHGVGTQSNVIELEAGQSVVVRGMGASLPTSQSDVDALGDSLFGVVYAYITPEGDSAPTFTVLGIQPFGDGELDEADVLGAFGELA